MITYEVNAVVDEALVPAYERYMTDRHISDLIDTGCFVEASFSRTEGRRYRIRYEAPDRAALERYFSDHAERLRGDFHDHFPTGVAVTREEWTVLKHWRPGAGERAG